MTATDTEIPVQDDTVNVIAELGDLQSTIMTMLGNEEADVRVIFEYGIQRLIDIVGMLHGELMTIVNESYGDTMCEVETSIELHEALYHDDTEIDLP